MNPKETVRTLMDAVQAGDFRKARSLLSSDFRFCGSIPQPLDGGRWIGLSVSLRTAFPNLDYHFGIKDGVGSVVNISSRLTGTHTGNLDLTSMDMGMMPATGKLFSMEYEEGEVTVCDELVVTWTVQTREGAGLMMILAQLTGELASNRAYV